MTWSEISEVFLPQGGYVIIHDVADKELGISPPVWATDFLRRGMHRNVRADISGSQYSGNFTNPTTTQSLIAMPHQDDPSDKELTFPNGDAPYTSAGASVIDIGVVKVTG